MLRCTSSRCVWLRQTVAALPPPDKSLHSACRRALRSKAVLELTLIVLSGEEQERCAFCSCSCVGAGLPAMAACQPTNLPLKSLNFPVGASLLAKAPCQPTVLQMNTPIHCGSWLASDGGLSADQSPTEVTQFPCGSEPAREGALPANRSPNEYPQSIVEAGLPAMAACEPTIF